MSNRRSSADALVGDYLLEVIARARVRLFAEFMAFAINEYPADHFPPIIIRDFSRHWASGGLVTQRFCQIINKRGSLICG